jgi:hypothetical protein
MSASRTISCCLAAIAIACGGQHGQGPRDGALDDASSSDADARPIDAPPLVDDAPPATPPCAGHVDFPSVPVITTAQSYTLNSVDLDGDGNLDLVFVNGAWVVVAYGKGDGTYGAIVNVSTGAYAIRPVIAADVDGDGKLDLVDLHVQEQTVGVFINQGSRTFAGEATYATGYQDTMAVADMNGDGKPDIVTLSMQGRTISVLMNNGTGSFAAPKTYSAGVQPYSLALADLNGDGRADVVITDHDSNDLILYFNAGDGTLVVPVTTITYPTGVGPESVALGDMDGDGLKDIVIAVTGVTEPYIEILTNLGSGRFGTAIDYPTPTVTPYDLVLGDVDGDGKLDVVVADPNVGIAVLNGATTGLAAAVTYFGKPFSAALGDMNNDGKLDVLVGGSGLQTLLNTGNGTFPRFTQAATDRSTGDLALADFDQDGRPDLAVTGGFGVDVLLNMGSGLGAYTNYPTKQLQSAIAIADLDNDGRPDLVTGDTTGDRVSVYLNGGGGTFLPSNTYTAGLDPAGIAIADLDGDGMRDIATANSRDQTITVLRGVGDGSFKPPEVYPMPMGYSPSSIRAADFNRDGMRDLAVGASPNVFIFLNSGNGTFTAGASYMSSNAPIQVADINQDGIPDIVSTTSVLFGVGDGTFTQTILAINEPLQRFVVRDLDGDQQLDLVSDHVFATWWRGHGDGTLDPPLHFLTASATQGVGAIGTADINGDGRPDIVTTGNGIATILFNTCH